MNQYYDGTKLLSLNDINGNKPEIYMCTTNRTGGKTTFFGRYLVRRFLKFGEKFCLLYRYKYEIADVADKFFKDIGSLFFPEYTMTGEKRGYGSFMELFLTPPDSDRGKPCGYAVSLSSADSVKKYSHLFSDVSRILFDEFQSETNNYATEEIKKFMSIHTSMARGQGAQTRYLPVYMLSNPVSIINPYYTAMGISERLDDKTKFLRGNGYVLEQGFVESASRSLKDSPFMRAFGDSAYADYAAQAIYLNDNKAFIERPTGRSKYLCTIRCDNKEYAIREYIDAGLLYCDNRVDSTRTNRIAVTTDDFKINYVMLKRNDIFIANMRYYFERGCFRFKDLASKAAVMKLVSY